MSRLAVYSPEEVVVIVAAFQITGFSSNTMLEIDKVLPTFSVTESSDGMVSRAYTSSRTYSLSLTLASTSDSNQLLTYLSRLDEITLMGRFPILIKDNSGQTLFFSTDCWINKLPTSIYSDSVENREWQIFAANAVLNVGGNYSDSDILEDLTNAGLGFLGGIV